MDKDSLTEFSYFVYDCIVRVFNSLDFIIYLCSVLNKLKQSLLQLLIQLWPCQLVMLIDLFHRLLFSLCKLYNDGFCFISLLMHFFELLEQRLNLFIDVLNKTIIDLVSLLDFMALMCIVDDLTICTSCDPACLTVVVKRRSMSGAIFFSLTEIRGKPWEIFIYFV